MKPHDILLQATRIIGLLALLFGVEDMVEGLLISIGAAEPALATARYWLARGFIKGAIGVYLMVGIKPFLNQMFSLQPETTTEVADLSPNTADGRQDRQPMKARAIFDVVAKVIGLIVVLYALQYLVESIMHSLRASPTNEASGQDWFLLSVIRVVVGLGLMRGLIPVANFAFPGETPEGERVKERSET